MGGGGIFGGAYAAKKKMNFTKEKILGGYEKILTLLFHFVCVALSKITLFQ